MSKAAGGGSALVGTAAAATLAVLSTGLVVSIAYRYLRHKQVCSLVHHTFTTAAASDICPFICPSHNPSTFVQQKDQQTD